MPDSTKALTEYGVSQWMVDAIERLPRTAERSLEPHLVTVGRPASLTGTGASCRVHFISRDGNGRPRVDHLARRLVDMIVEYCIPRSRILEARDHFNASGSPEKVLGLKREAQELFTHLEKSGEGGELLLYFLLEVGLRLPQLMCKMPLKTNAAMHVHGVDGVHGTLTAEGHLALYWCESKLFDDAAGAIRDCFDSLAPHLLDDGGGRSERDLLLVREHLDTGNPELTAALKRFLLDDTAESTQIEVRGACLVGFSLENYPNPFDGDGVTIVQEIADAMEGWHEKIVKRIGRNNLEAFEIDVFCVPLPSVSIFRDTLRERLGLK